tara:strand:+ start:38 stop:493 length:456 start_codon:yes stop_codon:yes gene_type:complete
MIGSGQIKKIENTLKSTEIGSILGLKIIKYESKSDKSISYNVVYKNLKYNVLNESSSFSFNETGDDFDNLYSMIMDGFNFENKKPLRKVALNYKLYNEIILDIGSNQTLFLRYGKKGFAPIAFQFYLIDANGIESWSYWLSKKQINKLFQK